MYLTALTLQFCVWRLTRAYQTQSAGLCIGEALPPCSVAMPACTIHTRGSGSMPFISIQDDFSVGMEGPELCLRGRLCGARQRPLALHPECRMGHCCSSIGPGCLQSTMYLFMILMLLWVNFCAACHFAVSFLSRILSAGLAVSQDGWWSLILLNLQNGLLILILHSTKHCSMQPPSVHPTRRRCLGSDKAASLESTLKNRRGFHLANGVRSESWLHRIIPHTGPITPTRSCLGAF